MATASSIGPLPGVTPGPKGWAEAEWTVAVIAGAQCAGGDSPARASLMATSALASNSSTRAAMAGFM